MRHNLLILILLVLSSITALPNSAVININSMDAYLDITDKVYVASNTDGRDIQNIQEALRLSYSLMGNKSPSLGISSNSIWLMFEVKNNSESEDLVLLYKHPSIEEIDLFYKENNQWIEKKAGTRFAFSSRKYKFPDFIFDLKIKKGTTEIFYIRLKSTKPIEVNLGISHKDKLHGYYNIPYVIFGLFIGIIFVMSLYNLFLFFSTLERSYIIYVIHTILIGITQSVLLGFAYQFFWPNNPWLENHSIVLFSSMVSVAGLEFQKEFLHIKSFAPKLFRVGQLFTFIYLSIIVLNLLFHQILSYNILSVIQILVVIYILFTAVYIAKGGYRPARFYLLAWAFFLIGLVLYVLSVQGVIPFTRFTQYILPVGSVLEIILLSFALADKINILKKEKETAQAAMIQLERANNKIIAEQNILLEKRVKQRTEELSKANEELSKAFEDLKNTQTQLVSAEKMASLGQLTAGIAHEINNPINFVSGSIEPLKRDVDDLIELFEKTQEMLGECEVAGNVLEKLEALKQEFEYDYVREEIENLLRSMKDGTERTVEIVKGLRLFSRVDESDVKKVNLHDGLDSTLILLNNMFKKYNIEVEKNYGPIPQVECYAGKINQVFINILGNAAQAIGENPEQTEPGKIVVTTRNDETHVYITIRDNGPGIPDDVKEKIFEPFFTTKPIGQGTGLGLSIVYTIIKNHAGTITVDSKPKKGTTFTIKLPIVALKEHTDGK